MCIWYLEKTTPIAEQLWSSRDEFIQRIQTKGESAVTEYGGMKENRKLVYKCSLVNKKKSNQIICHSIKNKMF